MREPETPDRPDEPEGPPEPVEPDEPETPETPGRPVDGPADTPADNPITEEETRSTYTPRTWRACCLAPLLAIAALLLLTAVAGLFSGNNGFMQRDQRADDPESVARREAFIEFGKVYFGIAQRADAESEAAFGELQKMSRNESSLESVHSAFSRARIANEKAAGEFNVLAIPEELLSRDKIRNSIDSISESYRSRGRACALIEVWNGDANDSDTASKYGAEVENINRTTTEGLRYLGEAATDNGLNSDDIRRIVPAGFFQSWKVNSLELDAKQP